jgi:hypothetical protein
MNSELLIMALEPTEEEIRAACRAKKDALGFDIEKAMFPHHPFKNAPLREISIEDAIKLVRYSVWDSVRDTVRDSMWDSVWDSVWDSMWDSVLDSVIDSVLDSVRKSVRDSVRTPVRHSVQGLVRGYISSIFYNIEKWEDVEHEVGVNPYQPSIDLWEAGYIPVYIKDKIQLHTKDGLVWEGE